MPLFEELLATIPQELLFSVFIPFILIFAILWGVLESLGLFSRRINTIIALALTLTAGYGGVFFWLSAYLMQLGAFLGVAVFVIVFIVGVALWATGRTKEIYYETAASTKKLERIDKRIAKLEKQIDEVRRRGDRDKERALWKTLESLERERRIAERELMHG